MKKYVLFHTVSIAIFVYLWQFFDILNLIVAMDPTGVTLIILSLYILASIYLGWFRMDSNFQAVKFLSSKFTGIGLVGTVIGIMLLLGEASVLSPDDIIGPLFRGMGTVLITTLFGILFNIILSAQVAWCFEDYEE